MAFWPDFPFHLLAGHFYPSQMRVIQVWRQLHPERLAQLYQLSEQNLLGSRNEPGKQLATGLGPLHRNSLPGLSDRKEKKMQQVFSYCAPLPQSLGLFLPGFGTHSVHLRGGGSNVKSLPLAPETAVESRKRKAGTELGKWPLELHNGDFPGRKPGWVTQQEFNNPPFPPLHPRKTIRLQMLIRILFMLFE